ncbi:chaperonin 10-like protein [Fomitopsis serialis]|uniref:chaperonin 10-like protein n=1 Tax=Fomitopsis serialis TaxID=139415 RepID=UPI0020076B0E|nr:chaperonin 10-like protein [Neoantrodia serialis]KAH9938113.1 chaperonin 10-like protein [Neoantrodia serialis]
MSSSVPKTMKALVTQANKTVKIEEIPVPEIDDWEILVKVVAAASNPTDWQYIDGVTKVGTLSGCDWSGHIVKLGSKVTQLHATGLKVGDHVAGFTQGGTYKDRGAYAEYVKATYDLCWKVPEGTISHEQAATMGCAYWTAVQCLFHPTRLGLVEPPSSAKDEYVFVYGGSSSVGMYALQLAHAAGYKVVTVASTKNHALCKSLGADDVFDYKDPEVVSKIKAATKSSLHYALDTISKEASQILTLNSFGPGQGKLVTILPLQEKAKQLRDDVQKQFTLIYTALGRELYTPPGEVNLYGNWPASPEDHAHMAQFLSKTPELVASGKVQPNPVKLLEGGLNAVSEGLQYLRDGKNSGEKLVYRVA